VALPTSEPDFNTASFRRLRIEYQGARLSLTPCGNSPLAAAIETVAAVRWVWGIAPDETFPAVWAAIARDAA